MLLVIGCNTAEPARDKEIKDNPNFVFLFADDQTFERIDALGFDEVYAPYLDRLVNGSTIFTHAYNKGV